MRELRAEYDEAGRGFALRETGGGWRFYTAERCAPYVERFVVAGQSSRLSQAALETLAIVAYQQPVTRGRVVGDPRRLRGRRPAHPDDPAAGRGGRT